MPKPADWSIDDVKEFQAASRDWAGNKLSPDGDWGPKTEWAYGISLLPRWRQDVVKYVCSYVGRIVEINGGNIDKDGIIAGWLEDVGVLVPSPYCAAFASAGLKRAGLPFKKSASALALGRSLHQLMHYEVLPADVLYYPTDDKGHGHIEIVIANRITGLPKAQVGSVGGNRDNGVRAQRRSIEGLSFASLEPSVMFVDLPSTIELVTLKTGTR